MVNLVDAKLEEYAEQHTTTPAPLLRELRDETYAKVEWPGMQTGPVEGRFLQLLCKLTSAKRVLELGMFTGYSALMMAEALPDDGTLVTCDIDPKAQEFAGRYFARSPHGKKIEIRLGPALETLATLEGPFDLAFIDADKENYPAYWEAIVPLMRPGGLIVGDNVLWSGRIVDAGNREASTLALRKFNDRVQADERVENVMLTVRDGMLLARKK